MMRVPSNPELLALWEQGSTEAPLDRALTILAFCSGTPRDLLALLSIGERDQNIIKVHQLLFGMKLESFARCPSCLEPLEYVLQANDLLSVPAYVSSEPVVLRAEGVHLRLRCPNTVALDSIKTCVDLPTAARALAEYCVVDAVRGDARLRPQDLSDEIIELISSTLGEADPAADMLVDLRCEACSHEWQISLDIERFLWSKLSAAARQLMDHVHMLACFYHWSEGDILAMGAARRHAYLEMACPTS